MANDIRYIFLIDDEPIQNEMLKDYLSERFLYTIETFDNGEEALKKMDLKPEIVVLDYHLNAHRKDAKNGLEVLKALKEVAPETQVVMLSGQDNLAIAVDSIKFGAYDYVVKGETAFTRVENLINNLSELHKSRTLNKANKITITLLISVIVLIAIFAVWYFFLR